MKTLKTSLLAFALCAGTVIAFATNQHKNVKTTLETVWYQTMSDTDSSPDLNTSPFSSQQEAIDQLGCDGGEKYCAVEINESDGSPTGQTLNKP